MGKASKATKKFQKSKLKGELERRRARQKITRGKAAVAERKKSAGVEKQEGNSNVEASENLTADEFLTYLVEAVKPAIDAQYRTKPEREYTSIMGSSMGGLISLYAISEYPEVYGAAGMVSTHWPIADGVLVDFFAERLPNPETHRLYFDFGTNTLDWNYEGFQDAMDAHLEAAGYERGVNWTTRNFVGLDH